MPRTFRVLVMLLLTAALVFAGGQQEQGSSQGSEMDQEVESAAPSGEQIRFRVAYTDPPRLRVGDEELIHVTPAAVYAFEDNINRSTGGRFEIDFQHSGALGGQVETIEQTQQGIIEATTPALPALASFYPNIDVFSIPYLFDNPVVAWEVIDGEFGQRLFDDMAAETGLRVIAVFDNGGYRNFSNNVRPIRTPEDMQGLKIRVIESPAQLAIVNALGASPTPIAFTELYSALQTGVVDGQENSPATMIAVSLQEVQRYYTVDQHTLSLAALVVSEDWFQSLHPDTQNKVRIAGRVAATAGRGAAYSNNKLALQYLRDSGVEVYGPTPEERAAFADLAQDPVVQWMRDNERIDDEAIDGILEATAAAIDRLGL